MSFKFTLLGLEFSKSSPVCADVNIEKREKMAKKIFSKKQITQQKKFKKVQAKCSKTTTSKKDRDECMSKGLTKKKSEKKAKKK